MEPERGFRKRQYDYLMGADVNIKNPKVADILRSGDSGMLTGRMWTASH